MDIMKMAGRNIMRNRSRTMIVILTLAISIASMTSVFSGIVSVNDNTNKLIDQSNADTRGLIDDVNQTTQEMIDNVTANTQELIEIIINDTQELIDATEQAFSDLENESTSQLTMITVLNGSAEKRSMALPMPGEIAYNISKLGNVSQVLPLIHMQFISLDGASPVAVSSLAGTRATRKPGEGSRTKYEMAFVINGIEFNGTHVEDYHLLPGNITNGSQLTKNDSEMVIIHEGQLDYFNASVGENISISGVNLTIKGVYASLITNNDMYMNIEDARSVMDYNPNEMDQLQVYAVNVSTVDELNANISFWHPDLTVESYKDGKSSDADYFDSIMDKQVQQLNADANEQIADLRVAQVEQVDQLNEDQKTQIEGLEDEMEDNAREIESDAAMIQTVGTIVLFISAFSAALIILFIQLFSVKERTKEIGVLKALGFSKGFIMSQLVLEGVIIGMIGGMLGIVISLGLGPLLAATLGESVVLFSSATISTTALLYTFLAVAVLSLIGGLYPAWAGARKPPMEAMRND